MILFGSAFTSEVNIQFILNIIGNLFIYGTAASVCHTAREGNDKVYITFHLLALHNRHSIVAVVDGGGVIGCNTRKGNGGNTLIRKRSGIAGLNILTGGDTEAIFGCVVVYIMYQCFLGSTAGDEFTHNTTDHIEVYVENSLFKLGFVGVNVRL